MTTEESDLRADARTALRGRRERRRLGAQLRSAIAALDFGPKDALSVERTRPLLAPNAGQLAEAVFEGLVASPDVVALMVSADGSLRQAELDAFVAAFERWIDAVVGCPLDADAVEFTAAYALA